MPLVEASVTDKDESRKHQRIAKETADEAKESQIIAKKAEKEASQLIWSTAAASE